MAWTPDELAQVKAAVLALATGKRTVSVSYAGPPARSVTYQTADLPALRDLLASMESTAGARGGYRLATTRKGLGR